jgi:hypothetical protein
MSRQRLTIVAEPMLLLLIVGSVLPYGAKAALGEQMPFKHRIYHALTYGSTAWLLTLIARNPRERVAAILGMIALGAALEYMQHCIYLCPYEWWDVRDDSFGVVAAALLDQWSALRRRITVR